MNDARGVLLRLARETITAALDERAVSLPAAPWLQVPRAVFVTLRKPDGALRGCVGSIEPHLPLGQAVAAAARAAAFRDGRFPPLSHAEVARVRLEVSVLSPLVPLTVLDEADACRQLERTRSGAVLRHASRQGVLLPKVWDSVGDPVAFLQHLKLKAGLPPTFWSATIALEMFTCEEFAESGERMFRGEAS